MNIKDADFFSITAEPSMDGFWITSKPWHINSHQVFAENQNDKSAKYNTRWVLAFVSFVMTNLFLSFTNYLYYLLASRLWIYNLEVESHRHFWQTTCQDHFFDPVKNTTDKR